MTMHRRPTRRFDLATMIGLAISITASLALGFLIGILASDLPAPNTIDCGKVESDCRPIYQGDGRWMIVFDPN